MPCHGMVTLVPWILVHLEAVQATYCGHHAISILGELPWNGRAWQWTTDLAGNAGVPPPEWEMDDGTMDMYCDFAPVILSPQ